MTTELDISKYQSATVHSDSVVIKDTQHGEIALSAETFERVFQQYLVEKGVGEFVTGVDE